MIDNNFSDSLVEEYDLFGKVLPLHDELQGSISKAISSHFVGNFNGGGTLSFLDIGAGYGFTTKLVSVVFPNAKYILNEYDANLLNRSEQYLGIGNYDKKVGDIEEVIKQIPTASVDGVYTAWVIHNFPPEKRKVIFKEVSRILKPSGIFVYLEKIGNLGPEKDRDLAKTISSLSPFIEKYNRPDLYLEWVRHYLRDEEPELVFTDDENKILLESNGFNGECVKHILLEKVFTAKRF